MKSRRKRRWLIGIASIVAALLAAQIVGSMVAAALFNRSLAEIGDYTAKVDSLRLALWRGEIDVRGFSFSHRGHEADPPIIHVSEASLALSGSSLFQGRLGGSVVIEWIGLNFIKREQFAGPVDAARKAGEKAEEKTEEAAHWQDVLRTSIPLELTRLEVKSGRVRFLDPTQEPAVDVGIDQLRLTATDLRTRSTDDLLPASVHLRGVTTGEGKLDLRVRADPMSEPFRFSAALELRELNLPAFNSFLRAYTDLDVSKGTFDLDVQVEAERGKYHGYSKPFFKNLDFENLADKRKPALTRLAESAVDALEGVLENPESEKVATAVPFSGTLDQASADIWTATANLLRNAFVEAIREGIVNQPSGG